jgi:hypothetical protein
VPKPQHLDGRVSDLCWQEGFEHVDRPGLERQ